MTSFGAGEAVNSASRTLCACLFCALALSDKRLSMLAQIIRVTIESPAKTWKTDSQECLNPSTGKSAMSTPRIMIMRFFGILFTNIIHSLKNSHIFITFKK